MFDLDKLFAEDNYLGLKNIKEDKVWYHLIGTDADEDDWFDCYQNQNLKNEYDDDWIVQRIIRLNNNGEIEEVLFDRDKDMPRLMPEIKNGMFVQVCDAREFPKRKLGVVVNNNIIYQNGGYDCLPLLNDKYYIDKIWQCDGYSGFNGLTDFDLIWSKN